MNKRIPSLEEFINESKLILEGKTIKDNARTVLDVFEDKPFSFYPEDEQKLLKVLKSKLKATDFDDAYIAVENQGLHYSKRNEFDGWSEDKETEVKVKGSHFNIPQRMRGENTFFVGKYQGKPALWVIGGTGEGDMDDINDIILVGPQSANDEYKK